MKKDFYTVRDVADQLQVKDKAVRNLIASGKLKASKVLKKWIITADNFKAFIDSNSV